MFVVFWTKIISVFKLLFCHHYLLPLTLFFFGNNRKMHQQMMKKSISISPKTRRDITKRKRENFLNQWGFFTLFTYFLSLGNSLK